MHLIDGQQSQLQDSVKAVERLRTHRGDQGAVGKIKTFSSSSLKDALTSAWLVVEVNITRDQIVHPLTRISVSLSVLR